MSAPPTYSTEKERREAAQLAGDPSDEELEASLRDEAHHHRPTAYVRRGETREAQPPSAASAAREAEGGQTGEEAPKSSHQKHHPHRHHGDTAADIAQHDRELYGVSDSTKLDSVRHRVPSRSAG